MFYTFAIHTIPHDLKFLNQNQKVFFFQKILFKEKNKTDNSNTNNQIEMHLGLRARR
jgi:hypothetical protein